MYLNYPYKQVNAGFIFEMSLLESPAVLKSSRSSTAAEASSPEPGEVAERAPGAETASERASPMVAAA